MSTSTVMSQALSTACGRMRMNRHTRAKPLGYTLIEVMIALIVFAVIAVISSSVLYHVFTLRDRVAKQATQLSELQLVMTLFEHDMVQLVPRSVRSNDMHLFSSYIGTNQYIEFTRGGLINPQSFAKRSGLKRIAYLCRSGTLIRRAWDVLDTTDRHRFEDKILLTNLTECSFSYISRYQQVLSEWRASALEPDQKSQILPSGVGLTLNPHGWGKMTFMFVIPEGLYAA